MEGNEKVTPPIDVSYINDFAYYNDPEEHDIRMSIMENSHKIKFLRENLNASVGEVRRIIKHCEMMNNQVEQMVSLQNQLYANLIEKKQVCGVNTRGGASTQDPDYPEDHPKRKEQEVLKKKSSAGKSPNENEDIDDSQEQDKDISISDAETEDDNNEEEESSPPEKEQHEAEILKNLKLLKKKTLNHLLRRIKRRSIQINKKVKRGIHGYKDPYHIPKR
jgi:hypothetical protein